MKYQKGSIVEVLTGDEVPSGSWHCAEIICGDGQNYTVRYEVYPGATVGAIAERVSRKSIRPCPPPVELLEDWVPGDIVEVFQNFSWKMATVSKVLGRSCFLVRLVGSFCEFKVSKFELRARQTWQGDKWFVIGKSINTCEGGKLRELSTVNYNQKLNSQVKKTYTASNLCVKDELSAAKKNTVSRVSPIVFNRTLKRGLPNYYSQDEAPGRTAQKFRVVEKEGRRHQFVDANLSCLPEKVDAVASHREMLVEKQKYTSFNSRKPHSNAVDAEREKPSGVVGRSRAISLGCNDEDDDDDTCSVASCSTIVNDTFKLHCNFLRGPVEDIEGSFSDAESVCQGDFEDGNGLIPTREELAVEIHRLELQAYHCTMEALHASGPLSWEREILLTNLRLSLHISNDEHLMELRNLLSTATRMPLS